MTVMPDANDNHSRGHKYVSSYFILYRYPFLSAEIFNCELTTMLDKFFEAPEVIEKPSEKTQSPQKRVDTEEETAEVGSPVQLVDKDDEDGVIQDPSETFKVTIEKVE